MSDQLQYWNNAHDNKQLHAQSLTQTSFAEETERTIPAGSTILELGCGEGNDSIYFAQQGHTVIATDFSEVVIKTNQQNLSNPQLQFKVQDISQPFDFDDSSFDVVYARLSLHYFTDDVTHLVFREIARVLKPGGRLCFMCKSVDDQLYGQGNQIEPDMFDLDGHIRHFFSEDYTQSVLAESGFTLKSMEKGEGKLYSRQSAFIKVVATKN